MKNDTEFTKGKKIIEDGKVYIIFKEEVVKTKLGSEKILHYRPFFPSNINSTVSCTMPASNLASSNIRKPATKGEINDVLFYLSAREVFNKKDLIEEAKNFKLNSILETARVLKLGLMSQKFKGKSFDISRNGVIKEAANLIMEEVALVFDITLEKAMEKIKQASKTYYSTVVIV